MKIKQYLTIAFGAILTVAIILGGITAYAVSTLRKKNERAQLAQKQLIILNDCNTTIVRMLKEIGDIILLEEEEELEEFQTSKNQLKAFFEDFKTTTESEFLVLEEDEKAEESSEIELANAMEEKIGSMIAISELAIAKFKDGDKDGALDLVEHSLEAIYDDDFAQTLQGQIQDEKQEMSIVYSDLESFFQRFQFFSIGVLLAMVVLVLAVANLVLRNVYRPIAALSDAMLEIGRGNFDVDIQMESQNEIGALAKQLKAMSDQLSSTQAQLAQSAKLASIGQLAAGVAHELNQPLMVIRMNAKMVSRQIEKAALDQEELATSMELIDRNTGRMKSIIDHITDFSRRSNLERKSVEINAMIEEAFTLMKEQLKKNGIEVVKDFSAGLPPIIGNENELEQVFLNLLSNAKDALVSCPAPRAKQISIATSYIEDRQCVQIIVHDTGIGIEPSAAENVFDPFFTTKPVGQGTGLGLSISYGIVQDHGGTIELVESTSEGTTFKLHFPKTGEDHEKK